MISRSYVEAFVLQYLRTGLWSELEDAGEPLDRRYRVQDIAPESVAKAERDCRDFIGSNEADLAAVDSARAGHLFWLTRNGHGTRFWDDGLGEPGDRLTAHAKAHGEACLVVGGDGWLHYETSRR